MPEKILVVDDDVDTLRLVGLMLAASGIPDRSRQQWTPGFSPDEHCNSECGV